jgi:AI-2 transport protein TqsA
MDDSLRWAPDATAAVTPMRSPGVIGHFPAFRCPDLGTGPPLRARPPGYDPRMSSINAPLGEVVAGPLSLLRPVVVLAALVILAAGVSQAQSLVATVAFGALAAVVCREGVLALERRGLGHGAAVAITVVVFVLIIGSLAAALVASVIALSAEVSKDTDQLATSLRELAEQFGIATGVPPTEVPVVDPGQLLSIARSLLSAVGPALTGLLMAVLIVTYLLLDAGRLRTRLLAATSGDTVARYDALATELVVYVKVRAVLGGAAAIADTALLLVLGVPYAVLWGVVSFLFSFVPNIGFLIALVPPTLLALLDGGLGPAIAVVVGYVAINLAFDYVLQPRLLSISLDLSPVVTIVSILAWTVIIGPMGALLAVPLTIAMRAVLLPFPGARWFVALLGPVPGASPAEVEREPTVAEAAVGQDAGRT